MNIDTAKAYMVCDSDKLCDYIADKLLDECLRVDRNVRFDCKVRINEDKVTLDCTTTLSDDNLPDLTKLVRTAVREVGYMSSCGVEINMKRHNKAVSELPQSAPSDDKNCSGNTCIGYFTSLSSGDIPADETVTLRGYATTETSKLLPLSAAQAQWIMLRFSTILKLCVIPGLLSGGSVIVSVSREDGKPAQLKTVTLCANCEAGTDQNVIRQQLRQHILNPSVPNDSNIYINIEVDDGQEGLLYGESGRHLDDDTYGDILNHESYSQNGKDGRHVSRSGILMARYTAKNIVAAGLADECTVIAAYTRGKSLPEISVDTHGTGEYPDNLLVQAVKELFDFRPAGMIPALRLNQPVFAKSSCHMFMGDNMPWEQTDAISELRQLCYQMNMEDEEY